MRPDTLHHRPAKQARDALQPRLPSDVPIRDRRWRDSGQPGLHSERPRGRVRAGHLQRRWVQQHLRHAGLPGRCGHELSDEPPAAVHERAVQQQWEGQYSRVKALSEYCS